MFSGLNYVFADIKRAGNMKTIELIRASLADFTMEEIRIYSKIINSMRLNNMDTHSISLFIGLSADDIEKLEFKSAET